MIRGRHIRKRPFLCVVWCRASSRPMVTMEMRMLSVEQRQITNNSLHCWCAACVYQRCVVIASWENIASLMGIRVCAIDAPTDSVLRPQYSRRQKLHCVQHNEHNFPANKFSNSMFGISHVKHDFSTHRQRTEWSITAFPIQHNTSEASRRSLPTGRSAREFFPTQKFSFKRKKAEQRIVCIQQKLIVVFILETFHLHIVVRRTNARVFSTILRSVSIRM